MFGEGRYFAFSIKYPLLFAAASSLPFHPLVQQSIWNPFCIFVGHHAVSQKAEIMLLDELFHKKLSIEYMVSP
ncbi:hypothetical protein GCM10010917_37750 [Paenibacillus physcomitrellae]|uniref:Uncharacterized protein n=1 Tax=Paenibacillus physcomitrellae TaxID=1619311 RepID=A0ABQ1GRD5_9BACL|nr:hypothetical protein GCM10010917_37750 [Paenibacillus physcomitrellae]